MVELAMAGQHVAVPWPIPVLALLCSLVLGIVLKYRSRAFGARAPLPRITTDKGKKWPSGPKGSLLLGNQSEIIANADRYLDKFMEWRVEHGLGYELTIPGKRLIEANHPVWLEHFQKTAFRKYGKQHLQGPNKDLQRTGIFPADGHTWMVQRKATTHAFSRSHFKGPIKDKLAVQLDTLLGLFDNLAVTGEVFDFQDIMARFTMLVSTSISFSSSSGIADTFTSDPKCLKTNHKFIESFDNVSPMIDARNRNTLWKLFELFDRSRANKIDEATAEIYKFIDPIIKERLEQKARSGSSTKVKDGDLLDLCIEQETDPWTLSGWMVNLLFAGRDTTAFSMAWQMHELMRDEEAGGDVLKKARMEAASLDLAVEGHEDKPEYLDFDQMKDLKFMNAVWQETTRLHPASPRGMMTCYEDDELPAIPAIGQPAVPVRKGDLVMWQDWVYNRLESVWTDACRFDPSRFLDEKGDLKPISLWKWHSFNAGPRTCLGKTLATYDNLSVFAALLPRYDFFPAIPDYKPKYSTGMNMGLAPLEGSSYNGMGLPMRVSRRK